MGAASLTSIVFSTLSGRFADRRGRRPLLLAGGAVMVACYLALALTPGLRGRIGIRLIAGAAEATFVVGAYTVIADIAPESRRGEALSLVTLASYLGLTIGPSSPTSCSGTAATPPSGWSPPASSWSRWRCS